MDGTETPSTMLLTGGGARGTSRHSFWTLSAHSSAAFCTLALMSAA